LNQQEREGAIKEYMRKYRKMNSHQTKQDYHDAEEDIRLLVKEKDRLYPNVKVQIAHVEVHEIGQQLHVTVMSIGER
jgi:hypothetical protein